MSKENVQLFFQKVQNDAELQEKIKSLIHDNQQAFQEDIIKLAAEAGYSFSPEDLLQFTNESVAMLQQDSEIDDAQLEAVAGGAGSGPSTFSALTLFLCELVAKVFKLKTYDVR